MGELALIRDITMIWLAALIAGYVCVRTKQAPMAGYIVAGIAIGPYGLKLISHPEQVSVLAELGVALLLFALGLEVSLKQVLSAKGKVLAVGVIQLIGTAVVAGSAAYLSKMALSPTTSFLFGFICALSSTAVVMKVLLDRGELDAVHGRILLPVLLIQDLSLIPIVSFIPVLQTGPQSVAIVIVALIKAALLIPMVFIVATKLIPPLLAWIARSNSRELFLLTSICLCMTIALSSHELGLSVALGAFLAGIVVSESAYGHQALAELLPVRDLFAIIFFVSVGMLLDPSFVAAHWIEVMLFVVVLIVGKAGVGTISALAATPSIWSAILVGVGLAQIGEFSFVLATLGLQAGIIASELYNLFLAGAVITLTTTPMLMSAVPRLVRRLVTHSAKRERRERERAESESAPANHVILCGYGRIGRNVGMVLNSHNIPFMVIELNAAIIEDLQERNILHIYGDAYNRVVLLRAGLRRAAALVVTIPDPIAAVTIIGIARHHNPDIRIVARAHRTEDIEIFRAAGANAVVQPEFEASVEITKLVLLSLNISAPEIQRALSAIRSHGYSLFRPDIGEPVLTRLVGHLQEDYLGTWFKVSDSRLSDQTIKALDIRNRTGATVLAIKRGPDVLPHPEPDTVLELGDELYVIGTSEQLSTFENTLNVSRFCPTTEATSDEISQQGQPG